MINRRWTVLLVAIDLLFFAALVILPLAWLLDPFRLAAGPAKLSVSWGLKPLLAPLGLGIVRVVLRAWCTSQEIPATGPLDRLWARKLTLAVLATYGTVAAMEGTLALVDYNVEMAPVIFDLQDEEGERERSTARMDPEFRWKFIKGEIYHGRKINSLGYRDREVDPVKAPGTVRVICMGDSVTAQGKPGYSQYLHDRLVANPPTTNTWEAFNMAVYGYSSVQGLRVFQLQTKPLEPDVVTLYFGWNDHWLEMQTDRNRMARRLPGWFAPVYAALKTKRVFMLATSLSRGTGLTFEARTEPGFRVPPDEYRQVLAEFIAEIRSVGAEPILITAPWRTVYPVKDRFPEVSKTLDYSAIHADYVQLTREIARAHDAALIDLAAIMADASYDEHFLDDGIHFKQSGLEIIGDIIHRKLAELVAEGRIQP